MEADTFPENAPEKSDIIDGCIGELSPFHETYGYYAHGVSPETAQLPTQWKKRLIEIQTPLTYGSTGLCLSLEDLAISKLLAGRDKDIDFVKIMILEQLISLSGISALKHELNPDQQSLLSNALRLLPKA